VSVQLDNPGSGVLASAREVVIEDSRGRTETLRVRGYRPRDAGRCILELEGIHTRSEAAALTHSVLSVERTLLDLDEEDLLVSDLEGREVVEGGVVHGRIRSSYFNGAHDVLVVETGRGLVDFPVVDERIRGLDDLDRLVVDGFDAFLELAYGPAGRDPS
jgi:ribosomal 30S subunit maturation factor RimM